MQETCSCGASIKARAKHVLAWRTSHLHEIEQAPIDGPQGSDSVTQIWMPDADPLYEPSGWLRG